MTTIQQIIERLQAIEEQLFEVRCATTSCTGLSEHGQYETVGKLRAVDDALRMTRISLLCAIEGAQSHRYMLQQYHNGDVPEPPDSPDWKRIAEEAPF